MIRRHLENKYPLWRTKQWPMFKLELDKWLDHSAMLWKQSRAGRRI